MKFLILSIFLSIVLVFQSCQQPQKRSEFRLTLEEEQWLPEFFRDVFLEEHAIYTLWGTKPLTAFDICYYTEEELKNLQQRYSLPQSSVTIHVSRYTIPENWDRWKKIQSRFPIQNFLFFEKQDDLFPKIFRLFFLNKRSVVSVLSTRYQLFEERVGFKFTPSVVISEIENPESFFWKKVFNNSELMGLLYGFGEVNASCFSSCNERCKRVGFSDYLEIIGEMDLSNFIIPIFASFSEKDKHIKKYLQEREKIKKIYKHHDFVHLTLKKLTLED